MGNKDEDTGEEETRELSPEEFANLRQGPVRRSQLPPELEKRTRDVWSRVGHLWESTFEQFELGFCRDMHPEREIVVWEAIADAFEAYMKDQEEADTELVLKELLALSMGATFKKEEARHTVLRRMLQEAWARRGGGTE